MLFNLKKRLCKPIKSDQPNSLGSTPQATVTQLCSVRTNHEAALSHRYIEERKDFVYYTHLKSLLLTICRDSDSICDVGPFGTDMLSFLPCKRKMSIDFQYPYSDEETEGIVGNYLDYEFDDLDIITCFQVLEHYDDNKVVAFAQKLLRDAQIVIVSVPYMWPKSKCKYHRQDPVDVDKLISWFGKNPVYLDKQTEQSGETRIIAVFVDTVNPEIDLDYWRADAKKTSRQYILFKLKRSGFKYLLKTMHKIQRKLEFAHCLGL